MLPLPDLERGGAVALGSIAFVLLLGWFGIRPLLLARAGARGSPAAGSLAAASGAVLCMLAAVVWAANPYAAALLLPAAHLWLFASAPQTRLVALVGRGGDRGRAPAARLRDASTTCARSGSTRSSSPG